jgi:hypothetical protein
MNLVERWFGHLDNKAVKRGVFLSVADLQASIAAFSTPGMKVPGPSSGQRLSNRFRRSSPAAAELSNKSSPAPPTLKHENGRKRLYSYFADTTLDCRGWRRVVCRIQAFWEFSFGHEPGMPICRSASEIL